MNEKPNQNPTQLSIRRACEQWIETSMPRYAGCMGRPAPEGESVSLVFDLPRSDFDGLIVTFGYENPSHVYHLIVRDHYRYHLLKWVHSVEDFQQAAIEYLMPDL